MGVLRKMLRVVVVGTVAAAVGCARAPEPLSPEAAHAKGDALLKQMSANLTAIQAFAYSTDEVSEQPKGGAKETRRVSRRVIVHRPNALSYTVQGDHLDGAGWYDGSRLTIIANRDKKWARGPVPATLDETMDYISAEYAMQLPAGDLLYSSPYDALMTKDTTGGWVDVQKIGELNCDHLAYRAANVDWEIWLGPERHLPCQARIIYKTEPGQPTMTVTFKDFDMSPAITDDTFTAKIPADYQRLKIMRYGTVEDTKTEAEATPASTTGTKK